uniref:Uncharacterized protein n=1 Tax=Cucumis melo TaxID=3656 RepID=A0A9I9E7Y3_CUCME
MESQLALKVYKSLMRKLVVTFFMKELVVGSLMKKIICGMLNDLQAPNE